MRRDCKRKGINFEDYIETPAGRRGEGKGSFAIYNYELKSVVEAREENKEVNKKSAKKPRKKMKVDPNKYAVKGISRPDMRKWCKRHGFDIKDFKETKKEWYSRPSGLRDMKYNYVLEV